jgi:prepilin-type N-terminal cleavage/methylation domain-containing protein
MRLIHKNQKGFTLIELLIVVAIFAVVAVVTNAVIVQVVQSNRTSNHMVAVRQVQQAGYRVNQDGVQAQDITVSDVPGSGGFPLTLSWTGTTWEGGKVHTVVYNVTYCSGGLCQLARNETVVNTTTTVVGPPTVVAQYICNGTTQCSWNNATWVLILNVTARVGLETESRTYEIKPRPSV